jgi:hypothetical protein
LSPFYIAWSIQPAGLSFVTFCMSIIAVAAILTAFSLAGGMHG